MSWQGIGDLLIEAAYNPRVMATILIVGFFLLIFIGRYRGLLLVVLLLGASGLFADTFRVHYSVRGVGRDITVLAASPQEARRTVMDMFPGAVVTGVARITPARR